MFHPREADYENSRYIEEKVQLISFGTFEVKARKESDGRNPKNPEEVVKIAASKASEFKVDKTLKDAVNK